MKSSDGINYILFDDDSWDQLLPLTFTRPVAELRIGILTIREKWEKYFNSTCSYLARDYLMQKFPFTAGKENVLINGSVLPTNELINEIGLLHVHQPLLKDNTLIACNIGDQNPETFSFEDYKKNIPVQVKSVISKITQVWEIFQKNDKELQKDFDLITNGRKSAPISDTNRIINSANVFIEDSAVVECSVINASGGPVYIGKNAEIMEGCVIRGAFALCDHSVLKIGAKVYGATTIGPHSKAGGELYNSVILGYSNKAHDGFLGNSVIGEWCNLGADTNTSNLKNNYATVKLWNYQKDIFNDTGLQFCGLIMGDHSKCGINTMFNTGTVVGVNANIFGAGFPRNFIPSFSWGGSGGFITFTLSKAFEVAEKVMSRRNMQFTDADKKIFVNIFDQTAKYRNK